MKNILEKIIALYQNKKIEHKENEKTKEIENIRDESNIQILPAGEFLNNRFDYSEGKISGNKDIINSMRFGIQLGKYQIMINALPQGSVYVTTGRKEIVTRKNSPIVENRIEVENKGHKIAYDSVVRFIEEYPAEHMYFLKGNYIFTRRFTPSIGGSQPKDVIENPTTGDFVFIGDQVSHKLEVAKPLINELEKEIGRKIIDDKYYSFLKNKDVFNEDISNAYKFMRSKLYW